MAIDTQRVSLDISKQPALQVVRLGQGDANGTELVATIYDEGQAYDLTGKAVRLRIQLPGGYAEYHVDGTVSGNEATFAIDEAYAASVAGITDNAYVEVLQGGTVVCSTSRFRVVILPSAYEGTDPAHIWDNGVNAFLQSANAQVRELTQDATQAITEAANAESSAAAELDAALEALGDISEIAVPEMSTTTRGGAMLGSGLAITEGKLHTQLVQGASGTANTPIQANGDLLHGLTVDGMSVQDGTPTPSAPVPVQVVETGNPVDTSKYATTSTGAITNDWPIGGTNTSSGLTFTRNADGSISVSGTSTGNVSRYFLLSREIPQGTQVALSGCPAGGGNNIYRVNFCSTDNTGLNVLPDDGATNTGTLPLDCNRVRIVIFQGQTVNLTFKPMVAFGTTPQPYVPYGSLGCVVRGRNLCVPTASNYSNGVRFDVAGDGTVKLSGTATATAFHDFASVRLEAGTYMVHGCPSGGSSSKYAIRIQNADTSTYLADDFGDGRTFTLSNAANIKPMIRVNSGQSVNGLVFKPMVEVGTTANPYTPYVDSTTAIPLDSNVLASLPDGTHDELTVDELGRVKIVKRVGVITFDGSSDEVWSVQSNGNRIAMASTWPWTAAEYPQPTASGGALSNMRSTRFQPTSANALASATVGVSGNNSTYAAGFAPILFSDGNGGMTAEAWNTWLQSNPVTVYYELATPTTIDLGTIDSPALADGSTLEILANLDTGVSADWWAVGAGAIGDALVALRDMLTALGAGE